MNKTQTAVLQAVTTYPKNITEVSRGVADNLGYRISMERLNSSLEWLIDAGLVECVASKNPNFSIYMLANI